MGNIVTKTVGLQHYQISFTIFQIRIRRPTKETDVEFGSTATYILIYFITSATSVQCYLYEIKVHPSERKLVVATLSNKSVYKWRKAIKNVRECTLDVRKH